ncbi:hypothetical protein KY319_04690 [Candidatus Woesearchaeota archaeon]|nr:hypothetical protein [Candidatus Woesearchaeota archaeon]
MRRLIVLVMVLLLAVFVYAQPAPVCGNGALEAGEECDVGADANCPGACDYSTCTCMKDSNFVLFDLAVGHNLLFSKVQDLLHIIKDMLFQLEIKTIEIQLTNFNCSSQPVSFWIPANYDPYGKLNEIDQLINLLIYAMEKNPSAFGRTQTELDGAKSYLGAAETCIGTGDYRQAFDCKCLAYRNQLLGLTDGSVTCDIATVCQPT